MSAHTSAAVPDAAAVAELPPIDPARVRLAITAVCDISHLAEQAGLRAAELYDVECDGRALVLQLLAERIESLANCVFTLLNDPEEPLDSVGPVVSSSRRHAEGGAA